MDDDIPNHPYRNIQIPSDAPFKLSPSPGKGWGAFATRRIERGAMILKEKPLFVISKPHQQITGQDIWIAVQNLLPSERQQFLYLRDNASEPFTRLTDACAENTFALQNSNDLQPSNLRRMASSSSIPGSTIHASQTPRSQLPMEKSLRASRPGTSPRGKRLHSVMSRILKAGQGMIAIEDYVSHAIAKPVYLALAFKSSAICVGHSFEDYITLRLAKSWTGGDRAQRHLSLPILC